MASREKKPIAPAKSKQKANNNFGNASVDTKPKKSKNLIKQSIICDIIEAVATNSQLPPKLEAGLPRKKTLSTLKCKTQKLKVVKSGLLKAKQKVPIKSLKRINVESKKTINKAKKVKTEKEEISSEKDCDVNAKVSVNSAENSTNKGIKRPADAGRSAKNNFRTSNKKARISTDDQVEDQSPKSPTKTTKKNPDSPAKSAKTQKNFVQKSIKDSKGKRNLTKEVEAVKPDDKCSIDLTIDEVIASMLSDSDEPNDEDKKMLVNDAQSPLLDESEIKKEVIEVEEERAASDEELMEQDMPTTNSIQLKKKSKCGGQRSLRNGKLRQLSDSGISIDLELSRRRKRLNSDDPAALDQVSDGNVDSESYVSESSAVEAQNVKDEDATNHMDSGFEIASELENNNNGSDRVGEVGPTLRSKTKTRGIEDNKQEEIKNDDKLKALDKAEDPKTIEALKKERILAKLSADRKCRRNNLNMEMKKAMNAFTPINKADETSQIDKMIENIKLTIVKSIESKIFGADKSLLLGKNFEVPKIEEVVAPLSAESQKLGLEENTDEEKPNSTKKDKKDAEDSVPKVADTAKEIEKLVMGDIEPTGNASTEKSEPAESNAVDEKVTTDERDAESSKHENQSANLEEIASEDVKKCATPRKSSRMSGKNTADNNSELDSIEEPMQIEEEVPAIKNENDEETEVVQDVLKKCTSPRKSARTLSRNTPESSLESEPIKKVEVSEDKVQEEVKQSEEEHLHINVQNESETELSKKTSPTVRKSARTLSKIISESSSTESETVKKDDEEASKKMSESTSETSISALEEASSENAKKGTNLRKSARTSSKSSLDSNLDNDVAKKMTKSKNSPKKEEKLENFENNEIIETDVTLENQPEVEPSAEIKTLIKENKNTDDNETLESISEEVERLVGNISGDYSDKNDNLDDIEKLALLINDVSYQDSENTPEVMKSKPTSPIPMGEKSCIVTSSENDNKDEGIVRNGCDQMHDTEHKQSPDLATVVPVEIKDEPVEKSDDPSKLKLSTTEIDADNTSSPKKQEDGVTKEENKRVLRARDKQRKAESKVQLETKMEVTEVENASVILNETMEEASVSDNAEPQVPRTRRSRDLKRRKEDPTSQVGSKVRKTKKDSKKIEQQNKEETLLDNEVAKINENKRNFEKMEKSRGDSEPSTQSEVVKSESKITTNRSKSENDIERVDVICESKTAENEAPVETSKPMDTDDTSASGDSLSSLHTVNKEVAVTRAETTAQLQESQENLSLKYAMLGVLGLTPLNKLEKQVMKDQKMKDQSTGTLKTIIKVNPKDKKRSRSPLKMVLKQGRAEGDGEALEFYTIQKELGTSGLGDSSSGANRKITTNHRPLCDEDNEDTPPKDRQSLVIPEKSSSFSIHPERLCADVCCYCYGKFGSLDTPMHLAQIKSDDRLKKILIVERHLTKDSCLCDACFRHIDRKAHVSPTNMQSKPQKQHRQLMNTKCAARDCKETAKHNVKRRWLIKIKPCVHNQIDIDWESSQHSSMSFCAIHYPKIEKYLTCALCKRRLAKNQTHQLPHTETAELNLRLAQHGIPVALIPGTFVCKLCRYFTQIQLKFKEFENMSSNTKHFFKNYRKKILHYHDLPVQDDDEMSSLQKEKESAKDKDKVHTPAKKSSKCSQGKQQQQQQQMVKAAPSKSPDLPSTSNPPSRKSTPEPVKTSTPIAESAQSQLSRATSSASQDELSVNTSSTSAPSIQYLSIESTIEKLKKRKAIDSAHNYSSPQTANDVVEILAMDKEVTLTRLPKRQKTAASQDITPVVQRLGANPSISVRTLFPGEEEMNLHANIEFNNAREVTPQGWEKCSSIIQYDRDTKLLWQRLQRPYGNQSSFLRHLILLEKYYRAGDLVLAPKASHNALNYSTSVRNRLISYDGPEKADEPIVEPIFDYPNLQRSSATYSAPEQRPGPSKVVALNPGVSLIKKPPPNLQRINMPSTSLVGRKSAAASAPKQLVASMQGGQVFQMSEPEYKKYQTLKKQKQMNVDRATVGGNQSAFKGNAQYQKTQQISQLQFQKHVRMQQEMLNRQSRGDFEPIICDTRSLANENNPAQNLLNNLNLPKSIQVTTKLPVPNPIPTMPKIPKSLTVIPQTIPRHSDK